MLGSKLLIQVCCKQVQKRDGFEKYQPPDEPDDYLILQPHFDDFLTAYLIYFKYY